MNARTLSEATYGRRLRSFTVDLYVTVICIDFVASAITASLDTLMLCIAPFSRSYGAAEGYCASTV